MNANRKPDESWRDFALSLKPHPLADAFPLMGDKEFAELFGSICTDGLAHPIVLDDKNRIVDGRNRLRACLEGNLEPKYVTFESLNFGGEIRDYIAACNLWRRHLTEEQRVMATAILYRDYRKVADEKRAAVCVQNKANAAPQPRVNEIVKTQADKPTAVKVAEVAKVSQHKAQNALKVVTDAPELAPKVAAGEMKLKDAVKVAEKNNPPKARKKRVERAADAVERYVAELMKAIDKARRALPTQAEQNRLITELIAAIEKEY